MARSIDLREHKEVLVIIAAVIIALFFSKKIWGYFDQKMASIKNEIGIQEKSIELAREIKSLQKQVEQFKELSWDTKESIMIMSNINELAAKHNITIYSFDPGALSNQGHFFILSMTLTISAEYVDLVRFLSTLEAQPALTKVKILALSPRGKQMPDSAQSRASLTLQAFIIK